jgi:antitoxin (DNA-binding transcriptional repressor) of toxin-antitoxin stability system
MEVPITQFRKNIFDLVNQASEGKEVRFTHKGKRFRIIPEDAVSDKLSRITPMDVIAPGVDLANESWKDQMMRDWELKWDRRLGPVPKAPRKATSRSRANARKAPRPA